MGLEDVEKTESTGLGDKLDVNRKGEEETTSGGRR